MVFAGRGSRLVFNAHLAPEAVEGQASDPAVGRARELAALDRLLDAAVAGSGAGALVLGHVGMGKTHLVAELARRATQRGVRVLAGRARTPTSRHERLGPLVEALEIGRRPTDAARARVARLLRSAGSRPRDAELTRRLDDAVVGIVEQMAAKTPLLLWLDDLAAAGRDTLVVLEHLLSRIDGLPILVVAGARPPKPGSRLALLVGSTAAWRPVVITLEPLTQQDTLALAEALLNARPGPRLTQHLVAAGGVPLFVREMLAAISEHGSVRVRGGVAEVEDVALPAELRAVIMRMLRTLPGGCLDVLRTASYLGEEFAADDLAAIVGRRPTELATSLQQAIEIGLVTARPDRFHFAQDLVRRVLYEGDPEPVRRAVHRQIGLSLVTAGGPRLRAAAHVAVGAEPGDELALELLRGAARDALPGAPTTARELLDAAVRIAGPLDPRRDQLLVARAEATAWGGQPAVAQSELDDLLRTALEPETGLRARRARIQALMLRGRWPEAASGLTELRAEALEPGPARSRIAGEAAFAWALAGEVDLAIHVADEVLGDHQQGHAGLPMAVPLAQTAVAYAAARSGHLASAADLADRAMLPVSSSATDLASAHRCRLNHAFCIANADRLGDALTILEAGRELADEARIAWARATYDQAEGMALYMAGSWNEARVRFEATARCSHDLGLELLEAMSHAALARIALDRAEISVAAEHVAAMQLLSTPGSGGIYGSAHAAVVTSDLAAARGEEDEALTVLRVAWEESTRRELLADRLVLGPPLVELALLRGDTRAAADAAAGMEQLAERAATEGATAAAQLCRGLVEGSTARLADAAERFDSIGRPYEHAIALVAAGRTLLASGEAQDGLDRMRRAHALLLDLGATRAAARTAAILRSHGMRHSRRPRQRSAATGWESLSPTELQVVTLAAQGLTNREIGERLYVSRRTVETHLSHAFVKLHVTSRIELAAVAARRSVRAVPRR